MNKLVADERFDGKHVLQAIIKQEKKGNVERGALKKMQRLSFFIFLCPKGTARSCPPKPSWTRPPTSAKVGRVLILTSAYLEAVFHL